MLARLDPAEGIRLLKRQVRKYPALLRVLQPPVIGATVALRRVRMARWYANRLLDKDAINRVMHRRIIAGTPSAFGKLGTLELELLVHDSRQTRSGQRASTPRELREQAFVNVGLFPPTDDVLWRAFDEIRQALREVDVLAVSGCVGEGRIIAAEGHNAEALCAAGGLDPWNAELPWSAALEDKRVLVVHPFAETVTSQYEDCRKSLWPSQPAVLPKFELQTLRMSLSAGITPPEEADWHERLDRMRNELDTRSFDVALIGAGGMSLPLAAHAKELGAIGVHMGGATQLLFGIRGRRWDVHAEYRRFFNDSWTRPLASETPAAAAKIEDGCYW
jgi:hypothetical protein